MSHLFLKRGLYLNHPKVCGRCAIACGVGKGKDINRGSSRRSNMIYGPDDKPVANHHSEILAQSASITRHLPAWRLGRRKLFANDQLVYGQLSDLELVD